MKRRRIILFGALLVLAACVVALWPRGPKEPVYQGKKLGEWIEEGMPRGSVFDQAVARETIQAIGTNALPYLLSEFARSKSKVAVAINQLASRFHWSVNLDAGEGRRKQAAFGILFLGPAGELALPVLARYLDDPEYVYPASLAMSGCGEAAIPTFLAALASTNDCRRYGGLLGLSHLCRTEAAIPHLLKLLDHPELGIRLHALDTLGDSQVRPDLIVPALIQTLTNTNTVVVFSAIRALGRLEAAARPAIPHIVSFLSVPNPTDPLLVSNALFRIDPAALPK